jgi:hypothetical protein
VQKTSALAALAALALAALAALPTLLAALSGLLLLLTRLLLAAALLAALTAALVLLSTLLTTLILLARLLFVGVHICSFEFPPWRYNKRVETKFLQAFCAASVNAFSQTRQYPNAVYLLPPFALPCCGVRSAGWPGFAHQQMFSGCAVRAKLDEIRNVHVLGSARFFLETNSVAETQVIPCSGAKWVPAGPARDEENRARGGEERNGNKISQLLRRIGKTEENPNDRQISDRCCARLGVCRGGIGPDDDGILCGAGQCHQEMHHR